MPISITGQLKVSTLQSRFLKEFGLTLRIYDGRSFADPDQTLAQVRKKKGSGNDLSVAKNMKVGNLEDKFEAEFGLKVQVAGSDDSYLCDNDLTLNQAQLEDEKKIQRKDRKSAKNVQDAAVEHDSGVKSMTVDCQFVINRAEFSEAEFGEIGNDLETSLLNKTKYEEAADQPSFLSIFFEFDNVSGINNFILSENDISIKKMNLSVNTKESYPVLSLDLLAEIKLAESKDIHEFSDWFNGHEDKNDLLSIVIEDEENGEEYYPDYVDEVFAEILK